MRAGRETLNVTAFLKPFQLSLKNVNFVPRLGMQVCVCLLTGTVSLERVPHVAVEVIVSGQQETAALGEGHGGDAADDVVVGIEAKLLVGPQVEQTTGGVI